MKFNLWPKLFILAGILLAAVLYFSKDNLRQDWNDLIETVSIQADNFSYPLRAQRSPPISALELQANLKSYVGEPFISFSGAEWKDFYNILYGAYPIDYSDNERLPAKVRQLNYSEMEEKLSETFPNPFRNFQEQHWKQFWPIAFGKKAKPR